MSDLTKLQIDKIKACLAQRNRELRVEIRDALIQSDQQHHKDLAGSVSDIGDESVADMLVDVDIALADRHVMELREVEAALQRIRDGDYGACSDCGSDIGHDRLSAYPSAGRCIRCQERHEMIYSRGTTPTL